MSTAILNSTNGSKPLALSQDWLQLSVQTFFTAFNWNDDSPTVQAIKTAAQSNGEPLSLALTVNQFFAAIPWDSSTTAASAESELPTSEPVDRFTLEDFSGLF